VWGAPNDLFRHGNPLPKASEPAAVKVTIAWNNRCHRCYSRGVSPPILQVKEDVAWLLEDNSDGGWKPVRDDGHTQVSILRGGEK